jgi:hypothetical protein
MSLNANPGDVMPGISESIQHGIASFLFRLLLYTTLLGLIMWVIRQTKTRNRRNKVVLSKRKEKMHEPAL